VKPDEDPFIKVCRELGDYIVARGQCQAIRCGGSAAGYAKRYCVVILIYVVYCVVELHIRQLQALDTLQGPVKKVYCITSVAAGPLP